MLTVPDVSSSPGWPWCALPEERPGSLPDWAQHLVWICSGYSFATQRVSTGRSVIARRVGDGPGPSVVITNDERDLRSALGLPAPTTHHEVAQ